MVLQDAVFESMTYAQYFCILLSSLNGVCGALAQSNYAAGCAFQDALIRNRIAKGQKTA
ncbi:hypothetical protein F5B20DRAFT_584742 [Whalleya microplaca]|nr:hypothetical protein F5B20DRAFT_584742 [Whalleya microplaca]